MRGGYRFAEAFGPLLEAGLAGLSSLISPFTSSMNWGCP